MVACRYKRLQNQGQAQQRQGSGQLGVQERLKQEASAGNDAKKAEKKKD